MEVAHERPRMVAVTMEASCARILERHRTAIRVQKTDVANVNLARIIEALKLSNKKGFHATTLRELAKASGLSMGGLNSYFDDTHIRFSEAMQPRFVFSFMESFPPAERKIATDAKAATEEIFAEVVARGDRSGDFSVSEPGPTAWLIKPLLQDRYVKRTKHRRRGTSIETYIASVTRFVEAAPAREGDGGRASGALNISRDRQRRRTWT